MNDLSCYCYGLEVLLSSDWRDIDKQGQWHPECREPAWCRSWFVKPGVILYICSDRFFSC